MKLENSNRTARSLSGTYMLLERRHFLCWVLGRLAIQLDLHSDYTST